MTIFDKLPFLTSTRFWSIFTIALAMYLCSKGFIDVDLLKFIQLVLGGHVIVRTIDRSSEKFGNIQIVQPQNIDVGVTGETSSPES